MALKRTFLKSISLNLFILAAIFHITAAQKPNVLLIIADDMNTYIHHPHFNRPDVITPNIDRLCNEGVTFTNAMCNWPSCAPSRQSFLSGWLPERSQYRFFGNIQETDGANRSAVYMPQHWRNNNYKAVRLDKVFHIGRDVPEVWDITEEPFKNPDGSNKVVSQTKELDALGVTAQATTKTYTEMDGEKSTVIVVDVPAERLVDGVTTKRALELLDGFGKDKSPFFMTVGLRRPHLPFIVAKSFHNKYDPSKFTLPPHNVAFTNEADYRAALQGYYAGVSQTDYHIGQLLDKLEQAGLKQNTIVVFFGDNGYGLGERNKFFSKGNTFNVSLHVPLIISVPGSNQKGVARSESVSLIDLYPTLSELCGLPLPPTPLDGKSIVPLLDGRNSGWVDGALGYAGSDYDNTIPIKKTIHSASVRYVEDSLQNPSELYDHTKDPFEWKNLISVAASSAVKNAMRTKMSTMMQQVLEKKIPFIIEHPMSRVAVAGEDVLFAVRDTGMDALTYSWFRNGNAMTTKNSPALIIKGVSKGDEGTYHCEVRNSAGRAVSYGAVLKVQQSAADAIDLQIDNLDPSVIVDGVNGTTFSIATSWQNTFGINAASSWYPERKGVAYVIPGLPGAKYEVSVWNPARTEATVAAKYTLAHANGSTDYTMNQKTITAKWHVLGTADLSPVSRLSIFTDCEAKANVAIDGFRFRRVGVLVNKAPVAVNDALVHVKGGESAVVKVLDNDTDGDSDKLTILYVSAGRYGNVSIKGTDLLYRAYDKVSGTDTIFYQAFDKKSHSNIASFVVQVGDNTPVNPAGKQSAPDQFMIRQKKNGQVSSALNIDLAVPEVSMIDLGIYDLKGTLIYTITNRARFKPGYYSFSWNGKNSCKKPVSAGTYLARVNAHASQHYSREITFTKLN